MFKKCSKCQEVKPATPEYFHRTSEKKDGLYPSCKVCVRKYHQANKEALSEYTRQWRAANPERATATTESWVRKNPEKVYVTQRKYYLAHQEESRQRSRNWRTVNRDKSRQTTSQWAKDNPTKRSAKDQRRRARKVGNGGNYTAKEWEDLCELYDYRCLACGEQKPLTVDHVVPLSKGGTNDIDNIQPLCRNCNSIKHDKAIDYRES